MKKSFTSKLLIFFLILLSVNAFLGGIGLITDPTGKNLGFTIDMLKFGPFNDFLFPGLFLLFVFGVIPLIVVYGLIKKPTIKFLEIFNISKKKHWSLTYSFYLGLLLIMWINIESIIIQVYTWLQFITSTIGVIIIFLVNLNKTKENYKK